MGLLRRRKPSWKPILKNPPPDAIEKLIRDSVRSHLLNTFLLLVCQSPFLLIRHFEPLLKEESMNYGKTQYANKNPAPGRIILRRASSVWDDEFAAVPALLSKQTDETNCIYEYLGHSKSAKLLCHISFPRERGDQDAIKAMCRDKQMLFFPV